MVKTLTPHGNSAALIIDKPVLELLNITFNTPLKITTDGSRIVIDPIRSARHPETKNVQVPKGQDQESGAAANRWGLAMGKAVAKLLGGVPLSSGSNEMVYEGERWVVKSAHHGVTEIGVTRTMLRRLKGIMAALENRDGSFALHKIDPDWFKQRMDQSQKHQHVMMVRCNEIRAELPVFKKIPAPEI